MEMSIPEKKRGFDTFVHLFGLQKQEWLAGVILGGQQQPQLRACREEDLGCKDEWGEILERQQSCKIGWVCCFIGARGAYYLRQKVSD